jgi:IclR family pca regulon transcriptional regulator
MSRSENPDFVEAIGRGLDVLRAFGPDSPTMSLAELATATGLPRPTIRRILVTLEMLGYVRSEQRRFSLTPRVLDLGYAYVSSKGLWQIARPHLEDLVATTHESSSMAQLDGSEIVYVGRVAVPKIVTIAVAVGTRLPAAATAMGRVLLAGHSPDEIDEVLKAPPLDNVVPRAVMDRSELHKTIAGVRTRGWALVDQELAVGIRSIAAPLVDESGRTIAAVNVCVQAAEHSVQELKSEYLPLLLDKAGAISSDFSRTSRLTKVVATS